MEQENPMLAVDVVAVRAMNGILHFGLAERKYEPHKGMLALPGVLMVAGETVADAARRALRTKLRVQHDDIRYLVTGGVHDTPDRDERGPTVAVSVLAVVDPLVAGSWWSFHHIPPLPFDHEGIIRSEQAHLLDLIWKHVGVVRALFGEEFTTPEFAAVEEDLAMRRAELSNIGRRLDTVNFLEKAGPVPGPTRGRPPTTWRVRIAHGVSTTGIRSA